MEDHKLTKRLRDLEEQVSELPLQRTSADVNVLEEERRTLGDLMADSLADAVGSWRFIIAFHGGARRLDDFERRRRRSSLGCLPFILLNLVLSCIAAVQAPVIMMSQNRLETRDRLRAENDFQVNVKAELLLEHLTEEIEALKRGLVSLGARFEEDKGASRKD